MPIWREIAPFGELAGSSAPAMDGDFGVARVAARDDERLADDPWLCATCHLRVLDK